MEYNRSLSALEQAQRVALHMHSSRFAPLGIDHEGRTYFALTPSMAEREAATALLAGDAKRRRKSSYDPAATRRTCVRDRDVAESTTLFSPITNRWQLKSHLPIMSPLPLGEFFSTS